MKPGSHVPELEQDVLGGLMLASFCGESAWADVADILRPEHFRDQERAEIFRALAALAEAGKPHDATSIAGTGQPAQLLMELQANSVGFRNLRHHAEVVRRYADRRGLIAILAEALQGAQEREPDEVIGEISRKLDGVLSAGNHPAVIFGDAVREAVEEVERAQGERKTGRVPGIPFGLSEIDRATGGMRPGELIGVAARTTIGKTAFANQVAVHAAMRGRKGLIVTLEENPASLAMRAIANRGAVPIARMRQGEAVATEVSKAIADNGLSDLPLWIDSRTFELQAIRARITQMVRRYGVEFAVVDHIGLVNVASKHGQKRYEIVGEVTRGLKQLAEHLRIPIMAVVQVGRDSEKGKRAPMLSDLRESGNIEQDLNVCVVLHQAADPEQGADFVPLKVGLIKNRYGPRGWLKQEFRFRAAIQRFEEAA